MTRKPFVRACPTAVALVAALSLSCSDRSNSTRDFGPAAPEPGAAVPGQGVAGPADCDVVADPDGSDANPGTVEAPFATAKRLVEALSEGQTGCLRDGTFDADDSIDVRIAGLSLTSYPGERATLKGLLKIEPGADDVTVRDLDLDARSSFDLGPLIFANDARFDNVDVSDAHTGICFIVGSNDPAQGLVAGTVIENSRIHDCGRLPATNGDHGVYVEKASGTVIRNNWIYDNADRGIQLYPDAQGTEVYGNVIDGNGEGIVISGNGETASSSNLIRNNVIANSKIRWNVESVWGGGLVGTGNEVRDNCVWATNRDDYYHADGGILGPSGGGPRGFAATSNRGADPRFVDAEGADFRLRRSSLCRALLGGP